MRIAVVSLNRGRGSGVVAREQMRALSRRGHRVCSVHAGGAQLVPGVTHLPVAPSSGVLPVHEYLPNPDLPQSPVAWMTEAESCAIVDDFERAIEQLGAIDLIVAHHANVSTAAVARVARQRRIPYVVFVHGTGIEPRFDGGYPGPIWRQIVDALTDASGILVTTAYVRDALVRRLVDLPVDRFTVIPCGVDLQTYHPTAGRPLREKYDLPDRFVISPGALIAQKGPQNVATAAAAYADLAPTVFIGDGARRHEIERTLGDRGRVLGFVDDADKAGLINEATILAAAPEKREHFGIIYVEALASGTVPVAYHGGGVDSIITPDVGVLTAREPAALGQAVRLRLEEREATHQMATRARDRAAHHYDTDLVSHRFVTWVEEMGRLSTHRFAQATEG
ncbi:MAG: glycosyltransferase family 4 protein [Acidimicrobiia bacterium]|nr:glycosyltransferase family 4 protein [Acidimicrobiia bacterium]